MRHDNQCIRISVVETSTILRLGLIASIKNSVDCDVVFQEVSNFLDFSDIQHFNPDIVIVNPNCGIVFNIKSLRQYFSDLDSEHTHFVALMSGVVDPSFLDVFDAQINLYDRPEDIHLLIDKLMGYDKHAVKGDKISDREKDVIRSVVKGLSNKEIADLLNISVYTVTTHRKNIARKLQIHSASALTIYAISNKLVNIKDVKNF